MSQKPALPNLMLNATDSAQNNISISPLYVSTEILNGFHPILVAPENFIGCVSLVIWSITALIFIK